MARSATGRIREPLNNSARRVVQRLPSGFTLIEVLVVVAIAAIVTALVVLRLGNLSSPSDPDTQVQRLAALIEHQCEQSMFQSRPRGIRLDEAGYDFWQSSSEGWVPLPDEGLDRPRSWVGEPELELVLDGHRVPLGDSPEAPQIVCHPLGELSPFSLDFRLQGQSLALIGEASGRLALERGR